MFLVFDTETTGIFDFAKPADADGQPRMCSIAAALFSPDGEELEHVYDLVRPDGWTVPSEAAAIHGLTTERLATDGIPVTVALDHFFGLYERADQLLGFGIDFDLKMLRGECRRAGLPSRYGERPKECVMRLATPLCKIPPTNKMMASGRRTFKTPKLAEAYEILLGQPMESAHDALADVRAAAKIYFFIKRKGTP